jgi:hypothetical protein
MTDYLKATGSTGTMMIRDDGLTVSFWLKAGSTTFNHNLPWGYVVAGVTSPTLEFDFVSGGAWQMLKSWNLTATQTVTFKIYDSGTTGLGGPTTFSQLITRTTVPSAPSTPILSNATATTIDAKFTDGATGGLAIDQRQLGWSTSIVGPTSTMASDGTDTITGLTAGTTYHVWARTHNANGWSAWSGYSTITTPKVPYPPDIPSATNIGPVSVTVVWTPPSAGDGGSPITAYEVSYGTDPLVHAASVTGTSPLTVTGLQPGTRYYFWVRAQNAVGWSAYSAPVVATTIAGVRLKVGAEWKIAIPYVNVGGVWKLAQPFVRYLGVWKGTV